MYGGKRYLIMIKEKDMKMRCVKRYCLNVKLQFNYSSPLHTEKITANMKMKYKINFP